MALSKVERINKIRHNEGTPSLTINKDKIHELCEVSYTKAVSIEIIDHLLGGENMEYVTMELEDSFQCYDYLHSLVMQNISSNKKEITFFEDRKNYSTSIIVVVTKEDRTSKSREHIVFESVVRMTIMVEPKVGFVRYFKFKGQYNIYTK